MNNFMKMLPLIGLTFGVTLFGNTGTSQAWKTAQNADSVCVNKKATINWSFSNTEPVKDYWNMTVKVTDKQTGATNTVVVNAGETKSGTFTTDKTKINKGTVDFYLTWTDGRSGVDSRTATYKATSDCAPVEKCQYNSDITADNVNCKPKCVYNNEIFADDAKCGEKCEYNHDILASDEKCEEPKEVCQYNSDITADHADCKEKCEYNSEIFADDANCKEPKTPVTPEPPVVEPPTITVVQPKTITSTGPGAAFALAGVVGSVAAAGHSVATKFRR